MGNLTIQEDYELMEKKRQLQHGAWCCIDGHRERLEKRIKELEYKQEGDSYLACTTS